MKDVGITFTNNYLKSCQKKRKTRTKAIGFIEFRKCMRRYKRSRIVE